MVPQRCWNSYRTARKSTSANQTGKNCILAYLLIQFAAAEQVHPVAHVDFSSRQDFVSAYVDYVFNSSVALLFEGFYAGFHKVCGGKVLELFQPSELQAMIIGNTNYDWTELEKVRFRY